MTGDAMREVMERQLARDFWGREWEDLSWREKELMRKRSKQLDAAITAAPASARLALARAITPDTHAVVPVEPDGRMVRAGQMEHPAQSVFLPKEIYRAMIAAARKESEHD